MRTSSLPMSSARRKTHNGRSASSENATRARPVPAKPRLDSSWVEHERVVGADGDRYRHHASVDVSGIVGG